MADQIVTAIVPTLPSFYVFMPILKQVLANVPDTTLFYVVYGVIENRLDDIGRDGRSYDKFKLAHKLIIPSIMVVLGLADAAIYLYAQVSFMSITTSSSPSTINNAVNLAGIYTKLHLTYVAAYVAVAIEILCCAILIFRRATHPRSKVRRPQSSLFLPTLLTTSQITTYLCMWVAPLLLMRSGAKLALTVLYSYLAMRPPTFYGILEGALIGIPSVFIFLGLLLIGFCKDWSTETQEYSYGGSQDYGVHYTEASPQFNNEGKISYASTTSTAPYTPSATPFTPPTTSYTPTNSGYFQSNTQHVHTGSTQYVPTSTEYGPTSTQYNAPYAPTTAPYSTTTNGRYTYQA